jgi:hypothetical protein
MHIEDEVLQEAGPTSEDARVEPSAEAGVDGAVILPLACPDEQRNAWRRFQMSPDLEFSIAACYEENKSCLADGCSIAPCLRKVAGVASCDECIAAEVDCGFKRCDVACGIRSDDDACRACLCAQGCLKAPNGCGGAAVDICADCVGASCTANQASITESITVPLYFQLLHTELDPSRMGTGSSSPSVSHDSATCGLYVCTAL